MATAAKGAHKTLLKIESSPGSTTFNTIAEVLDITGGGSSATIEDATSHDSNGWDESISVGLLSGGEVTFALNAIEPNTTQDLLYSTQAGHAPANFQLVFPDGTRKRSFAALVQNIGEEYPVKGKMVRNVTLKVTSSIVRSA